MRRTVILWSLLALLVLALTAPAEATLSSASESDCEECCVDLTEFLKDPGGYEPCNWPEIHLEDR